jgi:hypothetical protein
MSKSGREKEQEYIYCDRHFSRSQLFLMYSLLSLYESTRDTPPKDGHLMCGINKVVRRSFQPLNRQPFPRKSNRSSMPKTPACINHRLPNFALGSWLIIRPAKSSLTSLKFLLNNFVPHSYYYCLYIAAPVREYLCLRIHRYLQNRYSFG